MQYHKVYVNLVDYLHVFDIHIIGWGKDNLNIELKKDIYKDQESTRPKLKPVKIINYCSWIVLSKRKHNFSNVPFPHSVEISKNVKLSLFVIRRHLLRRVCLKRWISTNNELINENIREAEQVFYIIRKGCK